MDDALVSERPRGLPEALKGLGRTKPGKQGRETASRLHDDGAPPTSSSLRKAGEGGPARRCSFACVNACVYILLISVSGICILSGSVCWACFS